MNPTHLRVNGPQAIDCANVHTGTGPIIMTMHSMSVNLRSDAMIVADFRENLTWAVKHIAFTLIEHRVENKTIHCSASIAYAIPPNDAIVPITNGNAGNDNVDRWCTICRIEGNADRFMACEDIDPKVATIAAKFAP